MQLKIKKGLFSTKLINEEGNIEAIIRNTLSLGVSKKICDPYNKIIYTSDIINIIKNKDNPNDFSVQSYILYKSNQVVVKTSFIDTNSKNILPSSTYFNHLPRIETMYISTPYGQWIVKHQLDNTIIITSNKTIIGTISSLVNLKQIHLKLSDEYDVFFWSGIYVLITYMIHADDFIIV